MCVFPQMLCIYTTCMPGCSERSEVLIQSLGTRVTRGCEPLCRCWEWYLGPLQRNESSDLSAISPAPGIEWDLSFCIAKETSIQIKRKPTEWESYTPDRGLISRIYKKLIKQGVQINSDPSGKWAWNLYRDFSKEEKNG